MIREAHHHDAGLTLVELMIGMLLSSVLVGFIFASYAKGAAALRGQNRVADTQQALRSAHNSLVREIRMAGMYASSFRTAVQGATGSDHAAVWVDNAADPEGSDVIRITYADPSTSAPVKLGSGPFAASPTQTTVDFLGGAAVGDLLLAARTSGGLIGQGCVLKVTGVAAGPPAIITHASSGTPWNASANPQCSYLNTSWDDGDTLLVGFVARAFRIKPGDANGVLQMSPSGGLVGGDWVDLALGFVDLQVALRVYEEAGTDVDGDGDPQRNWYSGDNMETILWSRTSPEVALIQVRLTLLARSSTEVDAAPLAHTPLVWNSAMTPSFNDMSDFAGYSLPVADPGSRYHGNHVYRAVSTYIDMRNMGLGL